jgi:hypothetical protein
VGQVVHPDVAPLGRWLHSWIQPDGRVFGFHNHSVWGSNPYRWNDFTCGHSTWASCLIPGLVHALNAQPNADGQHLLETMVAFQTDSFQPDGNYRHVGFQVGERLKVGLIHNAIANVSLTEAAWRGADLISGNLRACIRDVYDRNLAWHGRANKGGVCNQDYARIWGKLLYFKAFDDRRWYDEVAEDIDCMLEHFHVPGVPDDDCEGTVRGPADPWILEPAEYYGLMIMPLILAAEIYGEERYLDHAGALCRHVARSKWTDTNGCVRFHRLYFKGAAGWEKVREPMLISGMGDTLEGIADFLRLRPDEELSGFLDECLQTYAHYQHPAGFFYPATGWQSEIDVAPSSAWGTHDFRFLVKQLGVGDDFWSTFMKPDERTAVLIGDQAIWMERGANWTIQDHHSNDVFQLFGRKDRDRFGRDLSWFGGDDILPDECRFPNPPSFFKGDDRIFPVEPLAEDVDVRVNAALPFVR